jgi:cell division protein FtsB
MARRRATSRRVNLRRSLLVLGLAFVGFLYYQPLRTYLDRSGQLRERAAEVQVLKEQKQKLERQLAASGTPRALAREARMQLSLVKPGERLFIVKGIEDWRRSN